MSLSSVLRGMNPLEKIITIGTVIASGAVVTARNAFDKGVFDNNEPLKEFVNRYIHNEVAHGTAMGTGFILGYYTTALLTKNEAVRVSAGIIGAIGVNHLAEIIEYTRIQAANYNPGATFLQLTDYANDF